MLVLMMPTEALNSITCPWKLFQRMLFVKGKGRCKEKSAILLIKVQLTILLKGMLQRFSMDEGSGWQIVNKWSHKISQVKWKLNGCHSRKLEVFFNGSACSTEVKFVISTEVKLPIFNGRLVCSYQRKWNCQPINGRLVCILQRKWKCSSNGSEAVTLQRKWKNDSWTEAMQYNFNGCKAVYFPSNRTSRKLLTVTVQPDFTEMTWQNSN